MKTFKATKLEIEFEDGRKLSYSGNLNFSYEPAANTDQELKGKLFLIVGPSGTGKTTLVGALKERGLAEVVSVTTRSPRLGEVEGVHYNFITREFFQQLVEKDAFIEHVEYN